MKKQIKNLGVLNTQQKEQTWKDSISGSQAWMMLYEPYNLLRDKLGIPRIHKSKYDIFKLDRLKNISDTAKENGKLYESFVFQELQRDYETNYISKDETFQLEFEGSSLKVTATPDFLEYDKDGNVIHLGDIKCSTSAQSKEAMIDRYLPQLLHNCYVMGIFSAEIVAKNEITKPLLRYPVIFTQEEIDDYENKLKEFTINIIMGNESAYDHLAEEEASSLQNENEEKDLEEIYEAIGEEAVELEELFTRKLLVKENTYKIKEIESKYKDKFDRCSITFNNKIFTLKSSVRNGSIDYEKLVNYLQQTYAFPSNIIEKFRQESTSIKTITIKEVA